MEGRYGMVNWIMYYFCDHAMDLDCTTSYNVFISSTKLPLHRTPRKHHR